MRLILVKEKKRDELSSICQSNVDAKHHKGSVKNEGRFATRSWLLSSNVESSNLLIIYIRFINTKESRFNVLLGI